MREISQNLQNLYTCLVISHFIKQLEAVWSISSSIPTGMIKYHIRGWDLSSLARSAVVHDWSSPEPTSEESSQQPYSRSAPL
jgi:hypothetical protein